MTKKSKEFQTILITTRQSILNFRYQMEVLKKNCAQTRILSNSPFNMRGNYFLARGTEKGFTSVVIF